MYFYFVQRRITQFRNNGPADDTADACGSGRAAVKCRVTRPHTQKAGGRVTLIAITRSTNDPAGNRPT